MPAAILSGKEIIKNVEEAPSKEVMNGWNWKRIHDEIMFNHSEVDENQNYKWAFGKWIIAGPKENKNSRQKFRKKKPAVISEKSTDGSSAGEGILVIPWRNIKSIEINLLNGQSLQYNFFENGDHKELLVKSNKLRSGRGRLSRVRLNTKADHIKRDYLRFKSLRKTARVHRISYETVRRILARGDEKI